MLILLQIGLLAVCLYLVFAPARSSYWHHRQRLTGIAGLLLLLGVGLPLTVLGHRRSAQARDALSQLIEPYPGATLQWVPSEAEANLLLAYATAVQGDTSARHHARAARAAAALPQPRYWMAETEDEPSAILHQARASALAHGWTVADSSSIYLVMHRNSESLLVSATGRWTYTSIVYQHQRN